MGAIFWFMMWLATAGVAWVWIMYLYLRIGANLEALRRWQKWEGELGELATTRKEAREKATEEGTKTVVALQQEVEALKVELSEARTLMKAQVEARAKEKQRITNAWENLTGQLRLHDTIDDFDGLVNYAVTYLELEEDDEEEDEEEQECEGCGYPISSCVCEDD
jgi:biopolymer transport protein ExbB/TolQ